MAFKLCRFSSPYPVSVTPECSFCNRCTSGGWVDGCLHVHGSWKLISEFVLIKASKLYNYFVGTKYIWWLLSARYSVFKVSVIILTVFDPAGLIIWEVLSLMFFFFPFSFFLFISLSELQVNYNNERSRCVQNTLTSFCFICNLNSFWLKILS